MIILAQIAVDDDAVEDGGMVPVLVRLMVDRGARAVSLRATTGVLAHRSPPPSWLAGMMADAPVPVWLDSPVADARDIERLARLPFARVVVGMKAVFEPMLLRWAHDTLGPSRMVVEIDVDGEYLYDAPRTHAHITVIDAVRMLRFQGVRHVLVRDVTGMELPIDLLRRICIDEEVAVSFTGRVRSLGDITELSVVGPRLEAVIVGEAISDGRIDIGAANEAAGAPD